MSLYAHYKHLWHLYVKRLDNLGTTCNHQSLKTVAVPGHQSNMQHRIRLHRLLHSLRVGQTSGGAFHDVALAGDRPMDGSYEPMEIEVLPEGRLRGYSEALGLCVCWEDGMLRFFGPVTESYLRSHEEEVGRAETAEVRAGAAEALVAELEEELRNLRGE